MSKDTTKTWKPNPPLKTPIKNTVKYIYTLPAAPYQMMHTDEPLKILTDEEFIEHNVRYTIEELIYNLNRDFINVDETWFRIL